MIRRSSSESEATKKAKIQELSESDELSKVEEMNSTNRVGSLVTEQERFISNLENALENPRVASLYKGLFELSFQKTVEEIHTRIDNVEDREKERDSKLEDMDRRIDEFEQMKRQNNIIITGPQLQDTKEDVKKLLNDKLKMEMKNEDFSYIIKLKNNQQDVRNRCRIRVAFAKSETKAQVMKKKQLLKGENLWICDDLTPYRDKLAFMCRQAVANRYASQTWTHDGKVFLKVNALSKPRKITKPEDIPRHQ